jgi:hypothetical protein
VAMVMIIAYHIVHHSVNVQLTDADSIARMGNGFFNHPVFYKKLLILVAVMPLGIVGNVVFVLITGYFLASREKPIDLGRPAKKLLLQMGFCAVVLMLASTGCYRHMQGAYITMIDISFFNKMSWFIGYYFALLVIGRVFLNPWLGFLDKKTYEVFLITVFALVQFSWTRRALDSLIKEFSVLLTGVFLFSFGGYLRNYKPLKNIRGSALCAVILILYGLIFVSDYNVVHTAIENYVRDGKQDQFIQTIPQFSNYSIVVVALGIVVFELFRRIHIPYNRAINVVGSSTLMVYLMHDNGFFYSIWRTQDWISLLYVHPLLFLCKLLLWARGTFIVGVVLYGAFLGVSSLMRKFSWVIFRSEHHPEKLC